MSENLEIPHVDIEKNGNIDDNGYVECSSDKGETINIEDLEIPHVDEEKHDNIDYSGYMGCSLDNVTTVDIENLAIAHVEKENNGNYNGNVRCSSDIAATVNIEKLGIPHIEEEKNGNIDYSGYTGLSSDNAATVDIEHLGIPHVDEEKNGNVGYSSYVGCSSNNGKVNNDNIDYSSNGGCSSVNAATVDNENLGIPHVEEEKNGNIVYSGYVGFSSDNAATVDIEHLGILHVDEEKNGNIDYSSYVGCSSNNVATVDIENLGIPHVHKENNGNIDYSGYVGCSPENAATINNPKESSEGDGALPFNLLEFLENPTEHGVEDDIDFFNLPAFDESNFTVDDLPVIDTHNINDDCIDAGLFSVESKFAVDSILPIDAHNVNDDSTDAGSFSGSNFVVGSLPTTDTHSVNYDSTDAGSFSLDDVSGIEGNYFSSGNHSGFVISNNHYIPNSYNNYNANFVNNSFIPGPANSANYNINRTMNYYSAPGASAMSTNFAPPTGPSFMTSIPSNHNLMQNLSCLGLTEPGGLREVEELARYSMEMADTNSTGWNLPIFSSNMLGWPWNANQTTITASGRCQFCQLLRRIIHTNGVQDSKLEIHGYLGQPIHAVSECRLSVDHGQEGSLNCEIIEFPTRNPEHVKQFIAQYNFVRRKEGCVLRYDSFLLNTDIGRREKKQAFGRQGYWNWNMNARGNERNGSGNNNNVGRSASYIPRSAYSAQRQRTGTMQMSELAKYFHLPIVEAASKLRICPTVMKKICRRHGLARWPHRKVKSIERKIQRLEISLKSENEENKENIRNQIAALREEQEKFYGCFLSQQK